MLAIAQNTALHAVRKTGRDLRALSRPAQDRHTGRCCDPSAEHVALATIAVVGGAAALSATDRGLVRGLGSGQGAAAGPRPDARAAERPGTLAMRRGRARQRLTRAIFS